MNLTRCVSALPLLLAVIVAAPVQAQPAGAPAGVEACKACHGQNGISRNATFPNLAGQKADYLVNQLKAFKAGERKNDFMAAIASQLNDAEIHSFAAYWASLPAAPADAHADTASAGPAIPSRAQLPADFPKGFTLYETTPGEGSVTERWANVVAVQAAKAGRPLPGGSILVQVNRAAEKDASGAMKPGVVKGYAAMESRTGWGAAVPPLLRNGDWDYAVFSPEKVRRDAANQAPCLACHKPMAADSYVFTLKSLKAAAAKSAG